MTKSAKLITLGTRLLLCSVLFPIVAWFAIPYLPREYTSTVTFEVKADRNRVSPFNAGNDLNVPLDSHFVADQVRIIRGEAILYPVIDELGLIARWSAGLPTPLTKEGAYQRLSGMLSNTSQVRNTDMLFIEVTSPDRQEAADIANTIAVIYQKKRRNDQELLINGGLRELKDDVDKQLQKVKEAQEEFEKIRNRDHIVDLNPDRLDPDPDLEKRRKFSSEKNDLDDAKKQVEAVKTQLTQVDKMSPEELMNTLTALNISNPTLSKENPDHLEADATAIKKVLQDRLAFAQRYLDSVQKAYDAIPPPPPEAPKSDYIKAKENYINARKLLDSAEERLETETMQLKITYVPAEIWDRAVPAKYPSPRRARLLMAVATGLGFLCAIPGVVLIVKGVRLQRLEAHT